MSEQTPGTQEDMTDGAEPSMEDILASIRKIIADDDTTALGSPELSAPDLAETGLASSVIAGSVLSGPTPELVADAGEFELPESAANLLGSAENVDAPRASESLSAADDMNPVDFSLLHDVESEAEGVVDLEIPDIETEAALETAETVALEDEDILELSAIDLVDVPDASPGLDDVLPETDSDADLAELFEIDDLADAGEAVEAEAENADLSPAAAGIAAMAGLAAASSMGGVDDARVADDDVAIDELLASIAEDLDEGDEVNTEEAMIDLPPELLATDQEIEAELPEDAELAEGAAEEDADLVLVKSLMADLTDEDGAEEYDAEAEDMLLADEDSDVLDDILDMTLADEVAAEDVLQADDIAALEAENLALNTDDQDGDATPSLSEIAAVAEANAGGIAVTAGGLGLAGAAMLSGSGSAEDDFDLEELAIPDMDDAPNTIESHTNLTPDETPEETADMARTAKKETLIDDATETATADVFASLNKVVEEKAVKAERGDRIGDLVMEALQPMLKDWLDANLKNIVERAVAKEVKRIASGK